MIVTIANGKGGACKTTTAIHMAAYLQHLAPTLLLDADGTRNAINWASRGGNIGVPFRVAPAEHAAKLVGAYQHVVIDTGQRPTGDDLKAAAEGCDLLVIPSVPTPIDTDGLAQTILALQGIGADNYKVLLARVAPEAAKDALELRQLLVEMGAPVFRAQIPRLKAFERASGLGTTVDRVSDPNAGRGWAAYEKAGEEAL